MANITELLEALNTKEESVSTADLAKELTASKETTLKQLNREKDKGTVEGNSQEGWLITEAGKKALEKGDIHPSMLDEGVTPRQQFEAIGASIGIKEDRIVLATDIVWSGEFESVQWVWDALGQADIRKDLRTVWVNAWRAKLQKGIPPELEIELTGASKAVAEAEKVAAPSKLGGRDYVIMEDEPVRVGENLGDYSLQDAKDILAIRALKFRFAGGQAGAGQGGAAGAESTREKVSDLLTALSPYLNKGSNDETLKELLATQLELQKQEILSKIPQQGQPTQPKSFFEQVTEAVTAVSGLKELGPLLRSILGMPETAGNPGSNTGSSIEESLSYRRFLAEERRSDERHKMLMGVGQTVRDNLGDGVAALTAAAKEAKGATGSKTTDSEPPQQIKCSCNALLNLPAGDWLEIQCPQCQQVWTREQVKGALGG